VRLRVSRSQLVDTFGHFRACGRNARECQVLWISNWSQPRVVTQVIHPKHQSHFGGFQLSEDWLQRFFIQLAETNCGVCAQVHTHPEEAFHSPTDDRFAIVQSPGFLSLVIPNFAQGEVGFDDAYLAEIQDSGKWGQVNIVETLEVTA
jgi:hypothetical protein